MSQSAKSFYYIQQTATHLLFQGFTNLGTPTQTITDYQIAALSNPADLYITFSITKNEIFVRVNNYSDNVYSTANFFIAEPTYNTYLNFTVANVGSNVATVYELNALNAPLLANCTNATTANSGLAE